jgi:hypothetical protein
MKVLKVIAGIVVWVLFASIIAYFATQFLHWLSGAFNIQTTFGSIVFLILTMPEVFCINMWLCLGIGEYFSSSKGTALALLVTCGTWQVATLLYNLHSITTWVVTISTIFAFLLVYLGKEKEA